MNTEINTRVGNVLNYLLREGLVKNQTDFCKVINYHKVSLNKVLNNVRPFPRTKVVDVVSAYGVSEKYLVKGEGPMLAKPEPVITKIKASDISVSFEEMYTQVRFIDEYGRENIMRFEST